MSLMEKDLKFIYSMSLKIFQQMRGKEDRADQLGEGGEDLHFCKD